MTTRAGAATVKTDNSRGVVGRSAATGRFVLSPASKGSSITVQDAIRVAENLQGKKK